MKTASATFRTHFIKRVRLLLFGTSMLLVSCVMPDPLFLQRAGSIQNAPYPASKIHGDWMTVSYSPIRSAGEDLEYKFFVRFLPGGSAEFRQFAFNQRGKQHGEMHATASWRYQGNNFWLLSIPGSEQFIIDSSRGSHVIPFPPAVLRLRWHEGRLFDLSREAVWIRLDAGELRRMKQRLQPVKEERQFDLGMAGS